MPVAPFYKRILEAVPHLPDDAVIPIPAVALLVGSCERTIKDTFPLVQISTKRQGVKLGYIRNRNKQTASSA
jgi:hypothetical protein